jgi:hypothetical protein
MATLPHTFEVPAGQPVTIYGESANINYFLNNDLTPDTVDGVTNGQVTVSAHTRQQYPDDASPSNVTGSSREFLIDPSRKSGSGLPGKSFVLVGMNETGEVTEKRQFTYKGRWIDLHAFLAAEAGMDMFAYNNTGARYTISEATAA